MRTPTDLLEQNTQAFIHAIDLLEEPVNIDIVLEYETALSPQSEKPDTSMRRLLYDLLCMEGLHLTLLSKQSKKMLTAWFDDFQGLHLIETSTGQGRIVGQSRWHKTPAFTSHQFPLSGRSPSFLLFAGESEAWFSAAHDWAKQQASDTAYTIRIAPKKAKTNAEYQLKSPLDLIAFLSDFSDAFQINCYKN